MTVECALRDNFGMAAMEAPLVAPEPLCPTCQSKLLLLKQGAYGTGRHFHAELFLFECPQHGHVFVTREGVAGPGPSDDRRDDDVPTREPRNFPPTPRAGTVALPEPD